MTLQRIAHQLAAAGGRVVVDLQPAARELDGALAAEDVPQAIAAQQQELVLRLQRVLRHLRGSFGGVTLRV